MLTPPAGRRALRLDVLGRLFEAVDAVRNLGALSLLLGTLAAGGLLLSMAQGSLARAAATGTGEGWAAAQALCALVIVFYGGNAAGLLLMDDAQGRLPRDPFDAVSDALRCAHRLLLVLLIVLAGTALLLALFGGLFWLSRPALAGTSIGPLLFGLVLPVAAVVLGLALFAGLTVVVPLAAPAVWSGADLRTVLRRLDRLVRHRLIACALLTSAVGLLSAAVAAMITFAVMAGARGATELAVAVVGIDLPLQQLMAGFMGYGLRSLGAVHAAAASNRYGAAALVGGGMVFSMALVLPGLVYLRGMCAVYLEVCADEPA